MTHLKWVLSIVAVATLLDAPFIQGDETRFDIPVGPPDYFQVFFLTFFSLMPDPSEVAERQVDLDEYIDQWNEELKTNFRLRNRDLLPEMTFDADGVLALSKKGGRGNRRLQSRKVNLNLALAGLCVGCGGGDVFDLQVGAGPGPGGVLEYYRIGFVSLGDQDAEFSFAIDDLDTAQIQHVRIDYIYDTYHELMLALQGEKADKKAGVESAVMEYKRLFGEAKRGSSRASRASRQAVREQGRLVRSMFRELNNIRRAIMQIRCDVADLTENLAQALLARVEIFP